MTNKKKYYVVWVGQEPGVYDSWQKCQEQIKNFPSAKYKSFKSYDEAVAAYGGDISDYIGKSTAAGRKRSVSKITANPVKGALSVDAACSGNPGDMEYRAVWVDDNVEFFRKGPFSQGTNNVGEFLALVHAIALLKKMNKNDVPIYTDSKIAMGWVNKKKANTKLKKTRHNAVLFDLIDRAEKWLKANSWKNPILKWPTSAWGEIPADFGRK